MRRALSFNTGASANEHDDGVRSRSVSREGSAVHTGSALAVAGAAIVGSGAATPSLPAGARVEAPALDREYSHHDVESLRMSLESVLGVKRVVAAMRVLDDCHSSGVSETEATARVLAAVGNDNGDAVTLVRELVHAERSLLSR